MEIALVDRVPRPPSGEETLEESRVRIVVREVPLVESQQLLFRIAEQIAKGGVDGDDVPECVEDNDPDASPFQDGGEKAGRLVHGAAGHSPIMHRRHRCLCVTKNSHRRG